MAKARVSIDCQHCGKRTVIDLMEEMSTQRCSKCGMRLSAVNTGPQEQRRKKVSGDPMLKRYETSEQPDVVRRRRRHQASKRWRIAKRILLLLVIGVLVATTYIVMTNPWGIHYRW